jgi:TetR/AcrR family transcriptional repressor of nem operon
MPYTAQHKARTRERIIESARRLFNRRGFERVTIDDVMAEASLTRGGFYNHFANKDELYAEAVRSFRTCNPFSKRMSKRGPLAPRELARRLVDLYLSDEILADVDQHCPLYALPSDIARAGVGPQDAYTELLRSMTHVYEQAFDDDDRDARRKAQLIVSLCVGGMVLARTTTDEKLKKSLRATARKEAHALLASRS